MAFYCCFQPKMAAVLFNEWLSLLIHMFPVVVLWVAMVIERGGDMQRGPPSELEPRTLRLRAPTTPLLFSFFIYVLSHGADAFLLNVSISIYCMDRNVSTTVSPFNPLCHRRLSPPSGGDTEVFVVKTTLDWLHRGRLLHLCVRVNESFTLARRQACKLTLHLLPQLDQITDTLHPPSYPCVIPVSLRLPPSILHSLTDSLVGLKDTYSPVT